MPTIRPRWRTSSTSGMRSTCRSHSASNLILGCRRTSVRSRSKTSRDASAAAHATGNPLACAAALASLEVFDRERTLVRLQPKIRLLAEWLRQVERMPEVEEVRQRGLMVGIDLGEHDPELRLGHRVVLEARRRGVIVRPLGDVIVLMPPLSISKQDLQQLVAVVAKSIRAACPVAEL